MKLKNPLILCIVLLTLTILATSVYSGEQKESFSYTRLYPDENGISHFTEARMELFPWIPGMEMYYSHGLEP